MRSAITKVGQWAAKKTSEGTRKKTVSFFQMGSLATLPAFNLLEFERELQHESDRELQHESDRELQHESDGKHFVKNHTKYQCLYLTHSDVPSRDAPSRDAPSRDAPSRDAPSRDALSSVLSRSLKEDTCNTNIALFFVDQNTDLDCVQRSTKEMQTHCPSSMHIYCVFVGDAGKLQNGILAFLNSAEIIFGALPPQYTSKDLSGLITRVDQQFEQECVLPRTEEGGSLVEGGPLSNNTP